jgi:hypothetical protein
MACNTAHSHHRGHLIAKSAKVGRHPELERHQNDGKLTPNFSSQSIIGLRVLTRRRVGTPSRARAKSWLIFFQIPEQYTVLVTCRDEAQQVEAPGECNTEKHANGFFATASSSVLASLCLCASVVQTHLSGRQSWTTELEYV